MKFFGARERVKAATMAEIAEELCITQRYLHALESDDLGNLPGTFFYKSFVKQYATLLGVPIKKLQPGIDLLTMACGAVRRRGTARRTGPK